MDRSVGEIEILEGEEGWSFEVWEEGGLMYAGDGYVTKEDALGAAWDCVDTAPECGTCGDQGHVPGSPYDCPDC